jgi:hypothetical protein
MTQKIDFIIVAYTAGALCKGATSNLLNFVVYRVNLEKFTRSFTMRMVFLGKNDMSKQI